MTYKLDIYIGNDTGSKKIDRDYLDRILKIGDQLVVEIRTMRLCYSRINRSTNDEFHKLMTHYHSLVCWISSKIPEGRQIGC